MYNKFNKDKTKDYFDNLSMVTRALGDLFYYYRYKHCNRKYREYIHQSYYNLLICDNYISEEKFSRVKRFM